MGHRSQDPSFVELLVLWLAVGFGPADPSEALPSVPKVKYMLLGNGLMGPKVFKQVVQNLSCICDP